MEVFYPESGRIFFTSDQHFFHKNIIVYCSRPYPDVETMNEDMVLKYRNLVSDEDYVFFLGDFSFGHPPQAKSICERLPGHKILVKGNHDRMSNKNYYEMGFEKVLPYMVLGPDKQGRYFYLAHHPEERNQWPNEVKRLNPTLQFCGHVHQKWTEQDSCRNVGVDVRDFTPISLESLLQ